MELTKQQVIDKVISFNYAQLAEWMKNRLMGKDNYFPVYLGHEPNLGEFMKDVFHHIKAEKFRSDFLEVLGDLALELKGLSPDQREQSKGYINELLYLCGSIEEFKTKIPLLEIAVAGDFKGIETGDNDLHGILLTTLASFGIAGSGDFWVKQLLDSSDKRYANPAFYALKDYPHKLFKHIGVFIDKFRDDAQLVLGLMFLLDQWGRREVLNWFKKIAHSLSHSQINAVNQAVEKAGYNKIFQGHELSHKRGKSKRTFVRHRGRTFSKQWQPDANSQRLGASGSVHESSQKAGNDGQDY